MNIDEVREMFAKDMFATVNGAYIEEVRDKYAKCSITLDERHKNALGAVMGGVYYTLADFTFAVATNWNNPGIVTLTSSITYLKPMKGKKITAEAVCVRSGKTTCYYQINLYDDDGTQVAAAVTTGFVTNYKGAAK